MRGVAWGQSGQCDEDGLSAFLQFYSFSYSCNEHLGLWTLLVRKEGYCLNLPSFLLPSIINVILKTTTAAKEHTDHLFYFMEFNFIFRIRSFLLFFFQLVLLQTFLSQIAECSALFLLCLGPLLPPRATVQLCYVAVLLLSICFAVVPRGSSQESLTAMLRSVSQVLGCPLTCSPSKKIMMRIMKDHGNSWRSSAQGPCSPLLELCL